MVIIVDGNSIGIAADDFKNLQDSEMAFIPLDNELAFPLAQIIHHDNALKRYRINEYEDANEMNAIMAAELAIKNKE